jgi:LytS/YehU family sensor histidine kinase
MLKSPLNYKTALSLAALISLLTNFIFILIFFYAKAGDDVPERYPHSFEFHISATLARTFFNFLTSFLLYIITFRLLRFTRLSKYRWLLIILAILIITPLISIACTVAQVQIMDEPPLIMTHIVGATIRDYFIAIIVMLSSQLMYVSYKQQTTALKNETLQAENMKTRFMALKNQVDPHFLFNSLNTLSSLIKTDTDKAGEYVQQLSYVFRYTLQNKEIITLEEELRCTLAYCNLMQIRYGESLRFVHRIDEQYLSASVAPLSLQTLVENAIKHNVVSNRQPLTISFFTSDRDTITVSNPIQPKKDAERGESIGLSNLAERYRLIWGREVIIRNTGGLFEAEIPLIR